MDLAIAVEAMVVTNSQQGNSCTPGHYLVASLALLRRVTGTLMPLLQKKAETASPEENLFILCALDEIAKLVALESALQSIVTPTVSRVIQDARKSRGEQPGESPLRVDYISTTPLSDLGIDHEVFDDYFQQEMNTPG